MINHAQFTVSSLVLDADGIVGRVVEIDDEQAVVVSDHGFGPEPFVHAVVSLTRATCDICEQPILDGERYTVSADDADIVEHAACTQHWLHRNFGREGLS